MISLILALAGFILLFAPHHARAEVFTRRTFALHISEMLHDLPKKPAGIALMAVGMTIYLSPFYPAIAIFALPYIPAIIRTPILLGVAILCLLCGLAALPLMIFLSTPIGFGRSRESTPRTVIFYLIPGFLIASALWLGLTAFIPRLLP